MGTIDYKKTQADGAKALRELLNAAQKVIAAEKALRENPPKKPKPRRQTFLAGAL